MSSIIDCVASKPTIDKKESFHDRFFLFKAATATVSFVMVAAQRSPLLFATGPEQG